MIKSKDRAKTSKGEQKRQAILQAARRCFEQFGYAKTTMDDIAKACQITKSSLFYYYDSKENLFYFSFTKVWEDSLVALIEEARAQAPVETRIQNYIRKSAKYYGEVVEQFRTPVSVLIETEGQFSNIFQPHVHDLIVGFFCQVLDEGCASGLFSHSSADNSRLGELIGKIERSFRADAFSQAHLEGCSQIDFEALSDDICEVVTAFLESLKT